MSADINDHDIDDEQEVENTSFPAIPKKLYDKAKALQVTAIDINVSGGSDNAYVNVDITTSADWVAEHRRLVAELEAWVWNSISYSGAGDGTDYGDDVTIDLLTDEVTTTSWHMERVENNAAEWDGGSLVFNDDDIPDISEHSY